MNFKKKRIVENKKDIKTQKDVLDNMDLETRKADIDKDIEDHKKNVDNFKDVIKQCSLVEGYNYTNDKNNYTVNIKNRAELAKLVESLKQNNIKHRISRSKVEGYKYDVNFKYTLNEGLTYKYEVHAVDDKDEDKVYKVFTDEQKAVKYAKNSEIKCFIDKVTYSDDEQTDSDTIYGPADLEEAQEKTEVKKVTTPRGIFEVVDKTEDELRKDGYGYHHSGNGYKIFVKNNQAVAIKECNLKEDTINQTIRKVSKQKGNNTPITDEDQKKEWEVEDENNWNESCKNKKLKEMFEPISSFKEYTYIDKTNQGWEIKKAFRDKDDDRLHVVVYRPKRDDYAVGLGYSPDGGYWNQGWYDYKNIEDAISDLKNEYNVEPFNLKLAKLKKDESLKESTLSNSRLKKGDKVKLNPEWNKRIEDQSLLDDEYEVVGFWNNEKVVDTDDAPDEFIDLSGIRIRNTRTGKEYSVNRYQLSGLEESLKEGKEKHNIKVDRKNKKITIDEDTYELLDENEIYYLFKDKNDVQEIRKDGTFDIDESLKLNEDPTQDRLDELRQISRQRQLNDDEVKELAQLSKKKNESLTEGEYGEDLELNEQETQELLENGAIDIARYLGSIEIHVEERPYEEGEYDIYIINPFDGVKLSINEALKEKANKKEDEKETFAGDVKQDVEFFNNANDFKGNNQTICEADEDDETEDEEEEIDNLDDNELINISTDDLGDIDLDSISVDDIVDENITALDILKDKLNIEVEDNKVKISEKDVEDEDAPQIEVEVEEEEAETLKNELTDEEPVEDEDEEEVETEEPKKDEEPEAVIVAIDGDVEIPEPNETDEEINFNNLGDEEPVDDGELTDEVKEDWKHLGSDMQFVEKKQNKKSVDESSESNDNNSNNNEDDDELVDYKDTDDAAPNM